MARAELTFATFNLFNLQLPGVAMYHGKAHTQAEYDAKIAWTASMLRRIGADVIAFQELWDPACLEDAFNAAGLADDYTLVAKRISGSINNALAVRAKHAVMSKTWVKAFPKAVVLRKRAATGQGNVPDYEMAVDIDHFSRPVLVATIKPKQGAKPAPEITVFNAHLKSKLPIRLDKEEARKPTIKLHAEALGAALGSIRRLSEAAALRVMLTDVMKDTDRAVVVIGDLNDTEHSVSNTIITADPAYRLFASSRAAAKSDRGLYASSSLQDYRSLRDVQYTHMFRGRHETLDHILVSEQFYDYSSRRQWSFKELRVFNDFLEDDDRASSDHAVVTSTFVRHPAKK